MIRTPARAASLILVSLLGSALCLGQVQSGTPPFASLGGGPFDIVNLGNLNVHFSVPILHKNGRGVPFNYDLGYDTSVWSPVSSSGSLSWQPVFNWGWDSSYVANAGYVTYTRTIRTCLIDGQHGSFNSTFNYVYHDPSGTSHPFTGSTVIETGSCGSTNIPSFTSVATDGSGLTIIGTGSFATSTITTAGGSVFEPGVGLPNGSTAAAVVASDTNGNQVTANSSGVFTDTLGTSVLTVAGAAPSPITLKYTAPGGALATYSVGYTSYNVKTNFACASIAEYNATAVPLVSSISRPDGTQYTFTYETTPGNPTFVTGRLKSVTLPTGGTITYTYTGGSNGIACADGSTAGLTRTLSPGGTWTYTRSQVSGAHWTTTLSDPTSPTPNQTLIDFQKDGATPNPTNGFYETQRRSYQGSTGGTVLKTTIVCYNGNSIASPSSCPTTAVSTPLLRTTAFTYVPDSSAQLAETDTTYNTYGLITRVDEYSLGSSTATRTTLTTYATLSSGIVDRPATVIVKDGSSVTQASASYGYDETGVTATSSTPQHVAAGVSRGNLTSINSQANGTTNLYRKFSYYDTGTLNTSTDVSTSNTTNGPTTTYTYATGTASCGNSFITSISEPLSLSRSMTWNCNGGVSPSATDENGKIASRSYTDAFFWRPASTTDRAGNITSISYLSSTRTESAMTFNSGSSAVDHVVQLDGFGLTIVSQTRQGPGSSSYDSIETDYNSVGQVSKVTLPYSGAAGALCSGTCPGTTTSYDGLGRVLSSTDVGGGSISYSYPKNDISQTLGPAPSGENTKRKQMEYDGLGRLTSVCEVTSGSGSGLCSQTGSQPTGYWTTYAYDVLNHLTLVTQNAQAALGSRQTRNYAYDMLGRLTSQINPETNNVAYTYSYDNLSGDASCATVTSAGDLLKRVDAGGKVTCYGQYSLHRVTSISYPSSTTPTRTFVYDSATVNGVAMSNAKTRLAEAYTCTSCPGTKITDFGFSYSARGEASDAWESTPHSGGYYHLTSAYWANGVVNTLSGVPTLPTITYGVDGEGRPLTVSASSGQNPVTSTSYNAFSQTTAVTFGSADNDAFTFDSNTGRLTEYKSNVGTTPQIVKGDLTWNANGTLQTLAITDPLNTSNTQICNYGHDDLARIASGNCGTTIWNQTFSYDPFGNITKSVPTGSTGTAFQPTYDSTKNRISSTPFTYDGNNGNLTADSTHGYAWDVEGKMISVDLGAANGVCLTYDALGRMVEQGRGTTCTASFTQVLYSPPGGKLALMNGQTLTKAFVPLPSGAQAVYDPGGLAYYRHADWLGSSRLSTTPGRVKYYDVAYAPFGEPYAGSGTQDILFTGQNQDTASSVVPGGAGGIYDFLFRGQSPVQGRWLSPDPAGPGAANPSNPQTWNRYAHVGNNPLLLTDPLGLSWDGLPIGISSGGKVFPNPPYGFGGGGGGPTCLLDGVESDCAMVLALLSSGAGYIRPSDCTGNYCITDRGIVPIHPIDEKPNDFGGCGQAPSGDTFCILFTAGAWTDLLPDLSSGPDPRYPILTGPQPRGPIAAPMSAKPGLVECVTNPGDALEALDVKNANQVGADPDFPSQVYANGNRGIGQLNPAGEAVAAGVAVIVDYFISAAACIVRVW